jgi:hypothetical protein
VGRLNKKELAFILKKLKADLTTDEEDKLFDFLLMREMICLFLLTSSKIIFKMVPVNLRLKFFWNTCNSRLDCKIYWLWNQRRSSYFIYYFMKTTQIKLDLWASKIFNFWIKNCNWTFTEKTNKKYLAF